MSQTSPITRSAAAAGGMDRQYVPSQHEDRIRARWESLKIGAADPTPVLEGKSKPYAIFIPPPNVTDRLHLGHALNNTLQDVLIRAHRMMGFETLWMPGTDHAGIATQTVVEKRLKREEGKSRNDYSREAFVAKVQAFKDEYEATITGQLHAMGCSCDWDRQRFTMDPQCSRAVREAIFRLFKDGLLYRGKRLVNWDPVSQTALADDEVETEEIDGNFYYLRYPLVSRESSTARALPIMWSELAARGYPGAHAHNPDEQAWVTVATTRPETYLGDTAVGINPRDPRAKALRGLFAHLPLVGRVIPIIEDDYVVMPATDLSAPDIDPKAKYATGFLKVTPAHDPNDYELGIRHKLPMINVMAPDASISDKHGWKDVGGASMFVGMSRELARREVVNQFSRRGLLEGQKPYRHGVGHSYRSHAPIEPYLSDQWYVKVTDERLAGAALRAMAPDQYQAAESPAQAKKAPGDGELRFSPARYARTFQTWHENIRDWCVSRQLWWGHRIPVWSVIPDIVSIKKGEAIDDSEYVENIFLDRLTKTFQMLAQKAGVESALAIRSESRTLWRVCPRTERAAQFLTALEQTFGRRLLSDSGRDGSACEDCLAKAGFSHCAAEVAELLPMLLFFEQDPDVLDTWFSSGLWPLSTLGWPDDTPELRAFNPSSTLCTAREIITLWVSRMVMFNRYFRGQDQPALGPGNGPLPYRDVFIHAMIQDEHGRKMSKSLGNGVDPLDIIATHGADAMRFTLCQMTTHTQDVRMPVIKDEKTGRNTSPKFDLGRNFCNKLWNAARFTISTLTTKPLTEPALQHAIDPAGLSTIDRWMLETIRTHCAAYNSILNNDSTSETKYLFASYAQGIYDLIWRDFCDWYLEAIKPTINNDLAQRATLRICIETIVRLAHPIIPFVTDALHEHLRRLPLPAITGIKLGPTPHGEYCIDHLSWPDLDALKGDSQAAMRVKLAQQIVEAVNQVRARTNIAARRIATLHIPPDLFLYIDDLKEAIQSVSGTSLTTESPSSTTASAVIPLDKFELKLSNFADTGEVIADVGRLAIQLIDRQRDVLKLQARLNAPGYVERAPAQLVAQSRDQLASRTAERDTALAAIHPHASQVHPFLESRLNSLETEITELETKIASFAASAGDGKQPTPEQKKTRDELKKTRDQLGAKTEERYAAQSARELLA